MADSEASKVCLVSFGASNRKISWNISLPDATLSDYDNIKIEFKKVFDDLVTAEEKVVFQKWDKDFEEWVDIDPLDSIENKSKLRAVCVRNEQRSSGKSEESEVKHTIKETGQATLPFSKQRTIGQNGKLVFQSSPLRRKQRATMLLKFRLMLRDLERKLNCFGKILQVTMV